MRVSPKNKNKKLHETAECFSWSKNDISFAQEHDICNYVRHNHKFMLDLNSRFFFFIFEGKSNSSCFKYILIKNSSKPLIWGKL